MECLMQDRLEDLAEDAATLNLTTQAMIKKKKGVNWSHYQPSDKQGTEQGTNLYLPLACIVQWIASLRVKLGTRVQIPVQTRFFPIKITTYNSLMSNEFKTTFQLTYSKITTF